MTDAAQPPRPSSQSSARSNELLGSMETLEEVQAAVEVARRSSLELGRREKKLVQRARELLRTVRILLFMVFVSATIQVCNHA
jgi:hypothetical protein